MSAKTSSPFLILALLAVATLFAPAVPLQAHHGSAMTYDISKTITLSAAVTKFAWINPHALLYVDTKDARGNIVHWTCEFTSPGVLARNGWYKTRLKPGDKITLTMHPSLSGAPVGLFNKITFPDGSTFSASDIGAKNSAYR